MLFRLPASTLMSTTRSRSRNVHSTSVTLRLPKTHSSTCNASRLAGVSKMWLTSLVTWRYWYVLLLYFVCYVLLSSPQLDSLRTRVGIEGFFLHRSEQYRVPYQSNMVLHLQRNCRIHACCSREKSGLPLLLRLSWRRLPSLAVMS